MFTIQQKLVIAGAALIAVLIVAVGYFGGRWLHGADVEPIPEHVLNAAGRSAPISVSTSNSSLSETDSVSESGDESFRDSALITDSDSTEIDEELETQLAALSDEELTALAAALEQDEGESSKYHEVPEGYPSNLTPVWIKDYFDEDSHANHVVMARVLIKLWNQGDHNFVGSILAGDNGRVYPLYPDVVYFEWDSYVYDGLNLPPMFRQLC